MPAAPPTGRPAAASYQYLDAAGPAELAWEWLRRDPDYRRLAHDGGRRAMGGVTLVAAAPLECTARWGCLNLPGPNERWDEAPVLWSTTVDPAVLKVLALPARAADGPAFDLRRYGALATAVLAPDCEHVLLRVAGQTIRLDVLSGSLMRGPVSLVHDFAGTDEIEQVFAALRRFLRLRRSGHLPARSFAASQRANRQIQALRVHDALALGASIRDVGVMLFGIERVQAEWADEALKSQCRRLIALSRFMVGGGYRTLLS